VEEAAHETPDPRLAVLSAWMLWKGLGTTPNEQAAWTALRPALHRRWPRALYLAWWLRRDAAAGPRAAEGLTSPISPMAALREAAQAGDALAQNALGVQLALQDEGRAPSATVLAWFSRAQQGGSPAAQRNLQAAQVMLTTRGDEAREAITHLTQRAQERDVAAMFELAQRHHRGQGLPQNLGEALRLYGVASYLGHAPSRRMLDLWARELKMPAHPSSHAKMAERLHSRVSNDAVALKQLADVDVTASGWTRAAPKAALWLIDDDPLMDLERLPV
jgi:uncharacterized protein